MTTLLLAGLVLAASLLAALLLPAVLVAAFLRSLSAPQPQSARQTVCIGRAKDLQGVPSR